MAEPGGPVDPAARPARAAARGRGTRDSIWPAIYPELLELVRAHSSTIVFVNNRRSAERVALRLNELAEAGDRARPPRLAGARGAHEGRGAAEGGRAALPGRDQLAGAGHRHGRRRPRRCRSSRRSPSPAACSASAAPGTASDEVSRGRIFPKFRGDLLECAVVARRMHEGLIEPTVVPRNALDVLAQQIVAIAVSAEPAEAGVVRSTSCTRSSRAPTPTAELSRELLENVLDMLDGRYPSKEFGELRARIVWDRLAGTIRARKGSRQLAIANAGTIPDRGLFAVTLPDGRRVGELDEEMVYEARPGQAFLLGASTWRIEEIGRDRVIVTPAPGAPGAVPFWKGDSVGRPEGARRGDRRVLALGRRAGAETLERDYDLDERAARNLLAYLREQLAATRVLPSERTIVVERFRDEIGDWRLCVLSPYGGPRPRRLGARAVGPHPRALRPGVRRDLVRRRDRPAPARPRRRRGRVAAVGRRAGPARARRGRAGGRRASSAARRCSAPASARTPRARC